MARNYRKWRLTGIILAASVTGVTGLSRAQTRVSVGVTETIETHNPYGDSVSLMHGIWSEVTGPFCTYSYIKGDFEGRLAERWKVENPTTWVFYLNKNYKFNDGTPVTADDVVHSMMNRVINDPQSKQKASVAPFVQKAEARRFRQPSRRPARSVHHIIPNLIQTSLVIGTFAMASSIIAEASLSFLGVGVPPEIPTWGTMLADARIYISTAWWMPLFPGLCIFYHGPRHQPAWRCPARSARSAIEKNRFGDIVSSFGFLIFGF